jgi:hypothetical protein
MMNERDVFFYFLNPDARRLLRRTEVRPLLLREISDITLLLNNETGSRNFENALRSLFYRVRKMNYPQALMSDEGMRSYLTYLVKVTDPSLEELRTYF